MQTLALRTRIPGAAIFLIAMSFFATAAHAQSGFELMVKPWPDKSQVSDGSVDAYLFQRGHTEGTGNSMRLEEYDSVGRFRILPGNEISPRIGYDLRFIDNHTNNPHLPNQLTDDSIAFGTGIAKYQGWLVGITVGGGYAGAHAFAQGGGWYGKIDLIVAKELNKTDAIGVILDYDGNRNYLPDTPLPGIGYTHRFDPKLSVVVGLPYSSVDWKPIDHLDIKADLSLYSDIKGSIAYEFLPGWSAYGTYGYVRDSFHVEGLGHNQRLLFFQHRAEAGIRYAPTPNFNFKVGLGYGWQGSYRSGFDFRNDNFVANVSDAPFLHGGFEWQF